MDQSLKALKTKWYRKLKDSGFEDIEDTESKNEFLVAWHGSYFSRLYTIQEYQERQEYFQQTVFFSKSYSFKTKLEERVWCLHSEGFSYREIAEKTKSQKDKVGKIVRMLIKKMRGF